MFPEDIIWQDFKHLTIVLDGLLHKLSFESLLVDDDNSSMKKASYLMKEVPISYSLGLHLSREFDNSYSDGKKLASFAPSFVEGGMAETRDCSEEVFNRLKCNEEEAVSVATLLDGVSYTNSDATTVQFKACIADYNIFHLATHACVDTTNYYKSSIIFEDGALLMSEMYETDWNNKTVVLSACNTAQGKIMSGEGVFNFARTLTELGCKEVIVSLWPIDDCSTKDFIIEYYSEIKKGHSSPKALQNARLTYLDKADKLHAQPYFWAPLILISNDRNVAQYPVGWADYWWMGAIGLGVISVGTFFINRLW